MHDALVCGALAAALASVAAAAAPADVSAVVSRAVSADVSAGAGARFSAGASATAGATASTNAASASPENRASAAADNPHILVFSRTEAFRHDSIDAGLAMLQAIAAARGWMLSSTEQAEAFTPTVLADIRVVVWLNTTGDVLDTAQQEAFSDWLESGGAYLGIHAASDCEYGWPWYGQLLGNGAWFESHPQPQAARLRRERSDDPSTAHLPESFELLDEWYNFRGNPRAASIVLLNLDEGSYDPGTGAMQDHPISWHRTQARGRVWYTGIGHRSEVYADTRFVQHVAGGLEWLLQAPGPVLFADSFE